MAYATLSQMQELGFDASQFGSPADWADANGYLQRVLDLAAAQVQQLDPSGYAGADSSTQPVWQQAELQAAAAELWMRRAARADASAVTALTGEGDRGFYVQQARRCEQRMLELIAAVASTPAGAGISHGHIETGRFVATSDARLNA